MESTLSSTATTVLGLSKTLTHSTIGSQILRNQLALLHLRRTTTAAARAEFRRSSRKFASPTPLFGLRNVAGGGLYRLGCVSNSAASFASGGGGVGGGVYSGGGGGGGGDGGEVKANPIVLGTDDVSAVSSDVIILDVGVSIILLLFSCFRFYLIIDHHNTLLPLLLVRL